MKIRSPLEPSGLKTRVARTVIVAWIALGLLEGSAAVQKNNQRNAASGAVRIRIGKTVEEALGSTDPVLPEKGRYRSFRLVSPPTGALPRPSST